MYYPYYIGFDIHKKIISYCTKTVAGKIVDQGVIAANRLALLKWASEQKVAWIGAMEATLFTGWVYDFLKPYAFELKVAHPEMLKTIQGIGEITALTWGLEIGEAVSYCGLCSAQKESAGKTMRTPISKKETSTCRQYS